MTLRKSVLLLLLGMLLLSAAVASAQESEVLEGRGELEMVLIHGLGSNAKVWDQMVPYLSGIFKVATFELAGHGQTQPIADPTIEKEVLRLEAFIKEQGFAYPTLVGHGMGGMIALKYSLDHPVDVHRLIMMDSAPVQLASTEQKKEVAEELLNNYDRFVAGRYSVMSPSEEITDQLIDSALKTDRTTFVSLLMSSFDFDVTDQLNTLPVPMLIIGSELLFPHPDQTRAILEQIGFTKARSISFKRLGQTGHFMMLEKPVYTSSIVRVYGMDAARMLEN
jgi:pimeloyl-ACP methyl ester carboxylesterase